jgi:B-box zinc finger
MCSNYSNNLHLGGPGVGGGGVVCPSVTVAKYPHDCIQNMIRKQALPRCRRSDRTIPSDVNMYDFNHIPVLLQCGHTLCRRCAFKCIAPHKHPQHDSLYAFVKCPLRCGHKSVVAADLGVEWLSVDVRRLELLRAKSSKSRHMCFEHKDRPATVCCTDPNCSEDPYMCADCDKSEHSARSASKHTRIPVQKTASASAVLTVCDVHKKPVQGVCETDGCPVCSDCLLDHMQHKVSRLRDTCQRWEPKLADLQHSNFTRSCQLSDRSAAVQDKYESMLSDAVQHCDELSRVVTRRRTQLLFELYRWRKMQVDESKMLAIESSQLGAQAMYELNNVRRALHNSKDAPDTALGSAACQAQSAGSACSNASDDLVGRIRQMRVEMMKLSFDEAAYARLKNEIESLGKIEVVHQVVNGI